MELAAGRCTERKVSCRGLQYNYVSIHCGSHWRGNQCLESLTLDLACARWRSCPNGLDSSVPRYSDQGDHQSLVGRSTMRHLRDELNNRLISDLRLLQLKRSCRWE